MKKSLVQTIVADDTTYGQVSNPADLMKAQGFVHDRISDLTHDFVNGLRAAEVHGCAYELGGGNAFTIEIKTPGRAYKTPGESYSLAADTELAIAAADEAMPRLDLVVVTLEDEVDAELSLIPFVRLRTAEEFGDAVPAYPPANINAPTEQHWRAVASIITGEPANVPTPPALASNQVPLYLIAVAPGATTIRDADVLDLREVIWTLRQLNEFVGQDRIDLANLTRRVTAVEKIANQTIDLSHVFGEIRTLGDILSSLKRQIDSLQDVPEIRYSNPKLELTDKATSQVVSTGVVLSTIPSVQIEIGAKIFFGNTEVPLLPQNFKDGALNARFSQAAGGAANVTEETDLILANVTQIAADGFTDFVQRASQMDAARARPGTAARDTQFVEVFGGLAADNTSKLGDWKTYDIVNDTITDREPSIGLPNADRPAAFSYGDGTHVLLISGTESDPNPQAFKINCVTQVVTEIVTTLPTGIQFIGDLISAGKIFIVALNDDGSVDYWEFDTATDEFTELGVTGSKPEFALDYADGCYYDQDRFVLVMFTPGVSSSGQTFIFDRSTLQWTELSIAPPFGDTAEKQLPLARFRMANVNGRALLVGGLLTKDTDATKAKIWELTPAAILGGIVADSTQWTSWDATFPPVQDCGFCSTLGLDDLPNGLAFFFAGHGRYSDAKVAIFSSQQGGLVATNLDGNPAITIADTSSFAQFIIDPYTADWDVAAYMLSLVGTWNRSNLKAEVSFDNGGNWHEVTPEETLLVTDSDTPGERLLRITFFNLKTSKPILSKLIEVFDEDGVVLETRIVIHYIAPVVEKALYLNQDGSVELSEDILPSTPERCLIHKVTPDGVNAPILKNYINRRRAHIKYTGTKDAEDPSTYTFSNELAVPVRYVDARKTIDPDGALYKIADPTVDFDADVVVVVDAANGWIVELEA